MQITGSQAIINFIHKNTLEYILYIFMNTMTILIWNEICAQSLNLYYPPEITKDEHGNDEQY